MIKNIGSVGKPFAIQQYEKVAQKTDASGFKATMQAIGEQMASVQAGATDATNAVLVGNNVDSHDVMIAAQEAGLAFDLMLEVRNKLVEAYQEIMRMQV